MTAACCSRCCSAFCTSFADAPKRIMSVRTSIKSCGWWRRWWMRRCVGSEGLSEHTICFGSLCVMCFKTLLSILAILPEIAAAENKRSVTRVLQNNEVCVTYKTRQEKKGPWGKGGETHGPWYTPSRGNSTV